MLIWPLECFPPPQAQQGRQCAPWQGGGGLRTRLRAIASDDSLVHQIPKPAAQLSQGVFVVTGWEFIAC